MTSRRRRVLPDLVLQQFPELSKVDGTLNSRRLARRFGDEWFTTGNAANMIVLAMRDGWQCHYCHVELLPPGRHNNYQASTTVDHVVPQSLGGGDDYDNLVLACRSCNSRKSTKPYATFVNGQVAS